MPTVTERLTDAVGKRVDTGRAERDRVPLESLAALDTGPDRPDPVSLLQPQDKDRVQRLVPIRHGRMRATPFTFYRGGAAIMASDLSRTPSTDLRAQLCGDAHLSNFGLFNGADRQLVFDVNDFDETSPGPFEWDLKRLAASVTIAGRNNELTDKKIRAATKAAVVGTEGIAATLASSPLAIHYYRVDVQSLLEQDEKLRKRSQKAVDKASRKDSVKALEKLTEVVDGHRRIVSEPPLIVPLRDFDGEIDPDRLARSLRPVPAVTPAASGRRHRPLPNRRHRPQGRRRRQRRDPLPDRPARVRRRRATVHAVQGSHPIGPRAVLWPVRLRGNR